jgi:hypothetical protein
LFANDRNLKELSVLSSLSYPYIKDQVTNLGLISLFGDYTKQEEPFKYVKKTTGIFIDQTFWKRLLIDTNYYIAQFHDTVSLDNDNSSALLQTYSTHSRLEPEQNHVYGLEPVKPNRIQFSSMSIEQLYSRSLLDQTQTFGPYNTLDGSVFYYRGLFFKDGVEPTSSWQSPTFGGVIDNWWRSDSRDARYVASKLPIDQLGNFEIDYGNAYNLEGLLTSNFTQPVANRHPSPLGVAYLILPIVRGNRRSMMIPVLTCKSKMKTSADSLVFETSQLFGMPKQIVVSPADINEPTIIPLGVPLGWNNPDTPISVNSFPQWGDRVRTDDIDSMGTTSLHVRVFEGWPIHQTFYFGHMFTPLHFNPSAPKYEQIIDYPAPSGLPVLINRLDDSGQLIPGRSEVDFKIPTAYANENAGGSPLGVGTSITPPTDTSPGNLAPYSLWKYNTIRRAKLLTNGGFVYMITYVGIIETTIKLTAKGTGYEEGDIFVYPDGTTVEITELDDDKLIKTIRTTKGEDGMTSVNSNIQPQYLGSSGKGAVWRNVQFIVKEKYGYDPAPKEVVPTTRLTKPSNNGEELIEGNLSTSVSLNNDSGKSKEYDIFYFYHNDPSHYSMNRELAFNAGWAQYAIVEVNPGA